MHLVDIVSLLLSGVTVMQPGNQVWHGDGGDGEYGCVLPHLRLPHPIQMGRWPDEQAESQSSCKRKNLKVLLCTRDSNNRDTK